MKHGISKSILIVYTIIIMFITFQYVDTAHAGEDPFIGEMSYVAFNFAPRGWASCNGQLLAISSNTALFSLLGTTYGGNGRTTFGLPDMRGRVPIHAGTGEGLSTYTLGQKGGIEHVTLSISNMPTHNHKAFALSKSTTTVSGDQGSVTFSATLKGSSDFGTTDDPSGNTLAKPYWGSSLSKTTVKAYNSDTPTVAMHAGSVSLNLINVALGDVTTTTNTGVTVDFEGSGHPFSNLQPYTVVRCIISLYGTFPSRN
ncbi:MAG: tail fiber protein [Desulfobacterales bacterium]|nr:tail fiber protein [Desulfobacterales bacterium]